MGSGGCWGGVVSLNYILAIRLSITEKRIHCGRITVSVQCSCSLLGCGAQYRMGGSLY